MSEARIILFGKLPSHGDFVARGLAAPAQAAWDSWLSEGVAAAREALGERFDEAYETAPPWRFVSGPGTFGEGWRAGALAASVDAVGRRFPILMAVEDLDPERAAQEGASLAGALEEAIRDVFERGLSADEAVSAARGRIAGRPAQTGGEPGWWTEGGDRHRPQRLAAHLGAADLLIRAWTPDTSEQAA